MMDTLIMFFIFMIPISIISFTFFGLSQAICTFFEKKSLLSIIFCKKIITIIIFVLFSLFIMSFYDGEHQR